MRAISWIWICLLSRNGEEIADCDVCVCSGSSELKKPLWWEAKTFSSFKSPPDPGGFGCTSHLSRDSDDCWQLLICLNSFFLLWSQAVHRAWLNRSSMSLCLKVLNSGMKLFRMFTKIHMKNTAYKHKLLHKGGLYEIKPKELRFLIIWSSLFQWIVCLNKSINQYFLSVLYQNVSPKVLIGLYDKYLHT